MAHVQQMREESEALLPDLGRLKTFLKGQSPLGAGPFWLLNFLKFKGDKGRALYQQYIDDATPLMAKVGGKPVLCCFTAKNVMTGGGAFGDWDGLMIGGYPSPAAFATFSSSPEYTAIHHHRANALEATLMIATRTQWAGSDSGHKSEHAKSPNYEIKAPKLTKSKAEMAAINGNPKEFMEFVSDERFDEGPVWMANLLEMEIGKKDLYMEYGKRAQYKISQMPMEPGKKKENRLGGGLQTSGGNCFVLSPEAADWHMFAIMQYPSKMAFIEYASNNSGSPPDDAKNKAAPKDNHMMEGFRLRAAGLKTQALLCLQPEGVVRDPEGPTVFFQATNSARL